MSPRTLAAALAAACALLSCQAPSTWVVVHTETNIPWGPSEVMRSLRMRVYAGVGTADATRLRHDEGVVLGAHRPGVPMPVRFGVLPLGDDATRVVTVEVQGCSDLTCDDGPAVLVRRLAIFSFIAGEQRELPFLLASNCRGVTCQDPMQTCIPSGQCVDAHIDPTQLVPSARGVIDASTPDVVTPPDATDAAPMDAGATDAPSMDAATTDARDAGPIDAAVADVRGSIDTGSIDTGPADTGPADTGAVDVPSDRPSDAGPPPIVCGTNVCRASENCCVGGACGCTVLLVCTPRGGLGCLL